MNGKLFQLGLEQARKSFAKNHYDYLAATNEGLQILARNGLGILIAQSSDWNGKEILEVFSSALEDANLHSEREVIESWIELFEKD